MFVCVETHAKSVNLEFPKEINCKKDRHLQPVNNETIININNNTGGSGLP